MLPGAGKWFLVISMLVYIAFFAISLGPLGWLIITEVFPTRVRGLGSSIGSLSNWGFNTLVVWTFWKMASAIGNAKDVVVPEGGELSDICPSCVGGVFWIFAAVALVITVSRKPRVFHLRRSRNTGETGGNPGNSNNRISTKTRSMYRVFLSLRMLRLLNSPLKIFLWEDL